MTIEEVKELSNPLDRFLYWIKEREAIRIKKQADEPTPYTDDLILRTFRFCNVIRADDKVSNWLWENWYQPNRGHRNILLAVALARFLNYIPVLDYIGFPTVWNPLTIAARLRWWRDDGNQTFSGAYVVSGQGSKIDKIDAVVTTYVNPLQTFLPQHWPTHSMEEFHKRLLHYRGYASFMAGQVVADMRWAVDGEWEDRKKWAPMGPGSKRGLNRLLGKKNIEESIRQYEFNQELINLWNKVYKKLPDSVRNRMEMIDLQNCLCEFDKYERALWNEGRPKQLYKPASD